MQRLGILGGTFDPIHIGHLIIAEEARVRMSLDQVLFLPAHQSPLKGEDTFFDAHDRCHMVSLAIADNPGFALSRIDVDRQGPSFTVDTLRLLKRRYDHGVQLYFIMGMDSLETFGHWRKPDEIIQLARLVVVTRPGAEVDLDALDLKVPGVAQATDLLGPLQIGISSTEIRRRLGEGLPVRYQVPEAVEGYLATRDHVRQADRA